MREGWKGSPLAGYRENARHLFGYPESTLREYYRDIRQFSAWLDERFGHDGAADRLNPLLACAREQVEEYVASLSNRGLKATTINRKIYALNSFYGWAVHHRLVDVSPVTGVRKLKTPRRIPKFLTFDDIQKLLTFTGSLRRTATIRGKQIHAMVSILYYLGLRREELVSTRFEHIEKVADGEIYLHVFGKGDKQRLVPFPEPAFQAYEGYARFRPECPRPEVFISLKTLRLISDNQSTRATTIRIPGFFRLETHHAGHGERRASEETGEIEEKGEDAGDGGREGRYGREDSPQVAAFR